jgi:hypothetical protein
MFVVTPMYALPLALIYLILWFRISGVRAGAKISYGMAAMWNCCAVCASMAISSNGRCSS